MALSYLSVDRDQLFLVPPSMRDWLPEGHLVWFVLDVVERVDTSVLHTRHPNNGPGRRAYDPEMLLALLIYAYCGGVRSSRRIERLCEVDVAFRVICAGHVPDHTTIARFRQDYDQIGQQLFVDVLELCAAAGLVRVGLVAVDGTKMAAVAAKKANRTRAQLEAEVEAMFDEARSVDEAEDRLFGDARGDELPEDLADRRRRRARLDAALEELERQRVARAAEEAAARAARAAKEQAADAAGETVRGRPPKGIDKLAAAEASLARAQARLARRRAQANARGEPTPHESFTRYRRRVDRARQEATTEPPAPPQPEPRVNLTDPDSRLMKTPDGWVQGYNAQAAATEDGVVVAAHVTQDGNDVGQCQPMMTATDANLNAVGVTDPVGTMLFDAGYLSDDNITAAGPDRLIATGKAWKLRREQPTHGPPPADAGPVPAMDHRLRTPEGSALYTKRQHTIEPVFGNTKHNRGFRAFSRRGARAADAEWKLMMATHNIVKLFRTGVRLA
jgi:transposase